MYRDSVLLIFVFVQGFHFQGPAIKAEEVVLVVGRVSGLLLVVTDFSEDAVLGLTTDDVDEEGVFLTGDDVVPDFEDVLLKLLTGLEEESVA